MAHDAASGERAGSGRRRMAAVQLSGVWTRVLEPPAAGRVYGGNVRGQVMHDVPSESLDDFAKNMRDSAVKVQKNKDALREMYAPKGKNKDRIRIQTRQQGGTLKYKRYELRIYSRSLKPQENQIWNKK